MIIHLKRVVGASQTKYWGHIIKLSGLTPPNELIENITYEKIQKLIEEQEKNNDTPLINGIEEKISFINMSLGDLIFIENDTYSFNENVIEDMFFNEPLIIKNPEILLNINKPKVENRMIVADEGDYHTEEVLPISTSSLPHLS